MKQDKWTQQLRDKMADYQTPAPDGLWDDIENALANEGAASRKARFVPLRRWAAAAAIAALIAGGGLVWWGMPKGEYRLEEAEAMISMADDNNADDKNPELDEQNILQGNGAELDKQNSLQRAVTRRESRLSNSDGRESRSSNSDSRESRLSNSDSFGLGQAKDPTEVTLLNDQADEAYPHDVQKADASTTPSKELPGKTLPVRRNPKPVKRNPSLNLYAMNSLGAKDNSNAVFMADALAKNYVNTFSEENLPAARRQSPIFLSGYEERQHHYQPVAFGLTLDYPLTNRLSLTSGVVYTRLRSDFTQIIRSQHISQEQTLHYVGLPLGLSYRLYQLGAFRAYAAAGFQADWNVAARQNAEGVERHMDRDKMQWSASASLGLQYSLPIGGTDLALYAEPGISHYFDNGSPVQNFFKDKPTSMKLQVGLRFRP